MNKSTVQHFASEASRRHFNAVAWSLSLLLAITAVSCGGLSHLTTKQRGGVSGSADTTVDRPLLLTSPRMTKYADLQISVTKGAISAANSGSDGANSAAANITLSITNTSTNSVRIQSGLWQLRLPMAQSTNNHSTTSSLRAIHRSGS
jgi:hypothetical protein